MLAFVCYDEDNGEGMKRAICVRKTKIHKETACDYRLTIQCDSPYKEALINYQSSRRVNGVFFLVKLNE